MSGGSSGRVIEINDCSPELRPVGNRRVCSSAGGCRSGSRNYWRGGLVERVCCRRSTHGCLVGCSCFNYFCSSCRERTFNERFRTANTYGFHDGHSTQIHRGVWIRNQHTPLPNFTKYHSHNHHGTLPVDSDYTRLINCHQGDFRKHDLLKFEN